jgi:prepilin-type processing-associated H-X9-DG protein
MVELLVVIAIIGVLASMLLPALKRARETAQTILCKSNLKQVGLSIHMYADDNNSCLPLANTSLTTHTGYWCDTLSAGGYTGVKPGGFAKGDVSKSVLLCPSTFTPSNPFIAGFNSYGNTVKDIITSYGTTATNNKDYRAFSFSAGTQSQPTAGVEADKLIYQRISRCKNPSGTIYLLDSPIGMGYFPVIYAHNYRYFVKLRHGVNANILFADNHTDDLTPYPYIDQRVGGFNLISWEKAQ